MSRIQELLEAGVHFGHLKRKWHPKMAPYIFMERNGIHIIDLYKTEAKLNEACAAMAQIAKSGKKILFVATKKQAKDTIEGRVKNINMPYVTERWPGGMLTNFSTIRKAVRKMGSIDKMMQDETFTVLSKRERLQITRQRAKLEKNLGSIADLNRLPAALFIIDIKKEHIAVAEAKKLNIPTFAIVDTNSNPTQVDFAIPANDDASKSIDKIMEIVIEAVAEGLSERKIEKDKLTSKKDAEKEEGATTKTEEAVLVATSSDDKKEVKKPEISADTKDVKKEDSKKEAETEKIKAEVKIGSKEESEKKTEEKTEA